MPSVRGRAWWVIVAATASVTVCGGTSVGAPSVVRAAAPSASLRLVSSIGSDGLVSLPGWTSVRTVVPSGDGSMLAHLDQSASNGTLLASGVVKVRPDGSLDPTFASTSARPGVVEAGPPDARVLVMSDGSFLLGRRHHRSDGSVDAGWGSDGFVIFNGVRVAFGGIAQFEASGNRIVSIRDMRDFGGCYSEIIGPDGELEPFTVRDIRCTEAVPVRMPDGRWYVVTHDVRTGYRIIGYTPDGQIDPTYVANPASAGPFERSGTDRVVVGFERRPEDRSRGTATLAVLEPGVSPLRVRPNGAAADSPAVRLGVVVDS